MLKLLGVEGSEQPASQARGPSSGAPASAAAAPVPDLLGGLEEEAPAPTTAADMLGEALCVRTRDCLCSCLPG